MRQTAASADPDDAPRLVTLPVSWDDRAAAALAAVTPGEGPISLANAAALWLTTAAHRSRADNGDETLATHLHRLLLLRQACPTTAVWRGEAGPPGYIINAAGFIDDTCGFDVEAFGDAVAYATRACRLLAQPASPIEIGLAGLDDLLACLGIPYDSRPARAVAACLAALLRARVESALEGDQPDLLATEANWPAPPAQCAVPGLAEAAAQARRAVRRTPDGRTATGIFAAGPAEAMLGIETSGIAPAFSPVRDRHLTRAAQHRLATANLSPEAALAATLSGEDLLPNPSLPAHVAMHDEIARFLETMPPRPASLPGLVTSSPAATPAIRHEPLPARSGGLAQKAAVAGHRIFLRTAEYADGRLGDVTISLPRETALARGLIDCLSQALSVGLQHGVPLDAYIDALALSDFAPAGPVEGDPAVGQASSVVDYVMRTLAANYLGRHLPEAEYAATGTEDSSPLLPLDLPRGASARARRRGLRLV